MCTDNALKEKHMKLERGQIRAKIKGDAGTYEWQWPLANNRLVTTQKARREFG